MRADLAHDPLEPRLRARVDVTHRRSDRRMDRADALVHRLGHRPVGGMTLPAGSELADVHRLAGVHVEHVTDPEPQAERVGRRLRHSGFLEPVELPLGDLERSGVVVSGAGISDLLGHSGTEVR